MDKTKAPLRFLSQWGFLNLILPKYRVFKLHYVHNNRQETGFPVVAGNDGMR